MELEAGVLLEAEEQAHLIKTPCILKCDLKVWKGKKVAWKGPGWYGLMDGVPTMVAPDDLDRPTLEGCGRAVCHICLKGRRHETPPRPKPIVEEQAQKRSDRIDMVYLEGKGENDEPISLALLPEEILYLQEDGPVPFIWSEGTVCPHLGAFSYDGDCYIASCGTRR